MAPEIIQAITLDEPDRPVISVTHNGRAVNYQLNVREDFGIRQLTRIEQLKNKIDRLGALDENDVTEEQAITVESALDEFVRLLIRDCPEEVLGKLRDQHKLGLLQAFTRAAQPPTQTEPTRAQRRTSTKSSRPSVASTAASRRAG